MNKKSKKQNSDIVFFDNEERELHESFERGEWESVPNVKKEIKRHALIAKNTIAKRKNVNLRLSARDLFSLKARALEEGMPYQTLMSSVLHKFVAGKLVDA